MGERVFVALGSNLGNRAAYLASARGALSLLPQTRLLAASRVEETAPFGDGAQAPYLNQMVALDSRLPPSVMLHALQRMEVAMGRVHRARWGPRTIDLDIVRFGSREQSHRGLTLPHPGVAGRAFWQRELAELGGLLEGPG